MARITIIFAVLLIALGIGTYVGTEFKPTALIPAGFGVVLLLSGLIALKEHLRKHAMHAASMVALLGVVAAVVSLIVRGSVASSVAIAEQVAMALLCGGLLFLCVRSFINARRARRGQ